MGAEVALVQMRKIAGDNNVTEVELPTSDSSLKAFAFFGNAGVGFETGYISQPGSAAMFPIKAGSCSWQVWLAARFNGFGFSLITNVAFFFDTLSFTGMGTVGTHVEPSLAGKIQGTGIYGKVKPGPIELQLDPSDMSKVVPASAPAFGLPPLGVEEDYWIFFKEGPGAGVTPEDASPTSLVEVLDLTPTNPFVAIPEGSMVGRAISVADQEPRYSNFAVLTLAVAEDADNGNYAPATVGLAWDES